MNGNQRKEPEVDDTDTHRAAPEQTEGHAEAASAVERRWAGNFMQPLELDDVDNLCQLAAEWGDLEEVAEFYNENVTVADLKRRYRHVRRAPRYTYAGFDLTVDEQPPRPTSTVRYVRIPPHSFADHLAHETTPWGRSRFIDPRIAAVVIEAFPIDASIDSIEAALELLPPLPPAEDALDPPDHSAPIEGVWAEWVIAARAALDPYYSDQVHRSRP